MDSPRFPLDAPAYEELDDEEDAESSTDDGQPTPAGTADGTDLDGEDSSTGREDGVTELPRDPQAESDDEEADGPSLLQRFVVWLATRMVMVFLLILTLYFALEALFVLF